ncbi:MAG: radical SAM protein [Nitrospirae bacterium]|nr:radical SAM protein [Nitrospirota bacterium]
MNDVYIHPGTVSIDKTLFSLAELPCDCSVAIYGAGQSGRALRKLLGGLRPDVRVLAFVDSFASGVVDSLEVVNVKQLESLRASTEAGCFIILVASDFWADIETTLIERGVRDYLLVDCHELDALRERFLSDRPEKPCHYRELFVRTNGDIFPCCDVGVRRLSTKIGHIGDANVAEKIRNFNACCSCSRSRLRRVGPDDPKRYVLLYIEVALQCNSRCPMCYADAPSWKGSYDYYEELTRLVDETRPIVLKIMGGEVLLQKKALDWVAAMRQRHPDIKFFLVTNGNYPLSKIPLVEELFHMVGVSTIVGFQPETYKRMTGLDLKRTLRFAEELVARKKSAVAVAYLMTPINLHEANLFLRWAIPLGPRRIHLADANVEAYIEMGTWDLYWPKIIDRTAEAIKSEIVSRRETMRRNGSVLWVTKNNVRLLRIDEDFITTNDLGDIVMPSAGAYHTRFEEIFKSGLDSGSNNGLWPDNGLGLTDALPFF